MEGVYIYLLAVVVPFSNTYICMVVSFADENYIGTAYLASCCYEQAYMMSLYCLLHVY